MTPQTYKLKEFVTMATTPYLPLPNRIVAVVEDLSDATQTRVMSLGHMVAYMAHKRLEIPDELNDLVLKNLSSNQLNHLTDEYDIVWQIKANKYPGVLSKGEILWVPTISLTKADTMDVISNVKHFILDPVQTDFSYTIHVAMQHTVIYGQSVTPKQNAFLEAIIDTLKLKG